MVLFIILIQAWIVSGSHHASSGLEASCLDFSFTVDLAAIAHARDSGYPFAGSRLHLGIDLSSVILIERAGRYYVTLRSDSTPGVPQFVAFVCVRFMGMAGPVLIGIDQRAMDIPQCTVGQLESIFRHMAGLSMNENPSDELCQFADVTPSDDPHADQVFGTFHPVGSTNMQSVRGMFSTSRDLESLFSGSHIYLKRYKRVAIVSRMQSLTDANHRRYVFNVFRIQDPTVENIEDATSFVFVDASVWNGAPETITKLLSRAEAAMRGNVAKLFTVYMGSQAASLSRFMDDFHNYLEGSTERCQMDSVTINLIADDTSEVSTAYEVVFRR